MNSYLSEHPDIFMGHKEMHYFGPDLGFIRARTKEDYMREFEAWSGEARVGESSVFYLRFAQAAQEIKAFEPDAKIIIMLRDPVEAMYSHYYQARFNGSENLQSFEAALEAEPARKRGHRISKKAQIVQELLYRENIQYSEQVRCYFETFGRENVHTIIYDDFKTDTANVYRETLEFLDVDTRFQPDFPVVNANKVVRSHRLKRFYRRPLPTWYKRLLLPGKILIPADVRERFNEWLRGAIMRQKSRKPMNPVLRQQLNQEMQPEVEKLGELLGRDLSHWCSQ